MSLSFVHGIIDAFCLSIHLDMIITLQKGHYVKEEEEEEEEEEEDDQSI
jgi:hypothetical protein